MYPYIDLYRILKPIGTDFESGHSETYKNIFWWHFSLEPLSNPFKIKFDFFYFCSFWCLRRNILQVTPSELTWKKKWLLWAVLKQTKNNFTVYSVCSVYSKCVMWISLSYFSEYSNSSPAHHLRITHTVITLQI